MGIDATKVKFSKAAIALLRGIVFKERQWELWDTILEDKKLLEEYFSRLGLELLIDEIDEYAYLKQIESEELPRLIPRHQLSYPVSLLLVLLRKQLGEYDAINGDSQLMVTRADIVEKLRPFFVSKTNEIKFVAEVDRYIQRVEEMGFLRAVKNQPDTYGVERILRSFVTANWLNEFEQRLRDYQTDNMDNMGEGEDSGLI